MDAQNFGAFVAEKLAFGGTAGMASARPATPSPAKPQPAAKPPVKGVTPANQTLLGNMPSAGKVLSDMSNNSQRVGGGILSSVAGGIGALGTGSVAGMTNLWNAATPKSMNTSQGWSQGVNSVHDKTVDFATAGVKDVYGGLGGDTNYNTQQSWNKMQQGFDDPAVDPMSRRIAETAGWTGSIAGNAAMAVGNPGKILTNAPRAGINPRTWAGAGGLMSKVIPGMRGGVQTSQTAARATPAAALAGRAANIGYDGVGGTIETANFANQTGQAAAQALAQPVPAAPPPAPQESYSDLAAQQAAARNYGGYMRDTLAENPTEYSYSQTWRGS